MNAIQKKKEKRQENFLRHAPVGVAFLCMFIFAGIVFTYANDTLYGGVAFFILGVVAILAVAVGQKIMLFKQDDRGDSQQ